MVDQIKLSSPLGAVLLVLAMLLFGFSAWQSGRITVSRFISMFATIVADPNAAAAGVRISPADAEAHLDRGAVLTYLAQPEAAVGEFATAISLRPRDYLLWVYFGMASDQMNDSNTALIAFDQAAKLAPSYSKPRWQRGNVLFRLGRYDEAFADLRQAVQNDPRLLPNLIDLSWGASGHDAKITELLVEPTNPESHGALATFFAKRGKGEAALTNYRAAGSLTEDGKRTLIRDLIANACVKEAFEIWSASHTSTAVRIGQVFDGGFEGTLNFDDIEFGWLIPRASTGVALSLDADRPHSGARSLLVTYNGIANLSAHILSQLVLVEPNSTYRLTFAARTKDIVTGSPPVLIVYEGDGKREIARSQAIGQMNADWKIFTVDVPCGATTNAILISLGRDNCAAPPCPIFGSLNLDSVSLERVR